jgi:hypothetical protein
VSERTMPDIAYALGFIGAFLVIALVLRFLARR